MTEDLQLPKVQAKTARGKRFLDSREPQVNESTKTALFVRSTTSSQTTNDLLQDLYSLKKPLAQLFSRKNDCRPFEDASSLEFFVQKGDASFAFVGSHSKKRPDHLTFARFFDGRILDMCELAVTDYISIRSIGLKDTCSVGAKPCFLFKGEPWEQDEHLKNFANMIVDCFRGEVVEEFDVKSTEHVIVCFATNECTIYWRVYRIHQLKGGEVDLQLMGPSMTLRLDRTKWASEELVRESMRQPKENKPKKTKNVEHDELANTYGRVHVGKQDLSKLQTRKMKALKKQKTSE